jgi:hypothetical protein
MLTQRGHLRSSRLSEEPCTSSKPEEQFVLSPGDKDGSQYSLFHDTVIESVIRIEFFCGPIVASVWRRFYADTLYLLIPK